MESEHIEFVTNTDVNIPLTEGPLEMESEHIVTNTDVSIPFMERPPEMESKQIESVISNTDDIPLRAPVRTSHLKKMSKSSRRDRNLRDIERTYRIYRKKTQFCYCKSKPVKPVISSKKAAIFQLMNESKKFLAKELYFGIMPHPKALRQ
ncbi:uncharacterized protein LOC123311556 [Coccinella septempunctata]|uniref:uncharacterized protein LOC123311556 n=1 Tax=Coccinella septempunctata TaxID=41139 RepID=UPI001D06D775|nr:uncharacterized protein LOC123311556 [Coccinella septempunctata]